MMRDGPIVEAAVQLSEIENFGYVVPDGWSATVVLRPGRCCPRWKEVHVDHMLECHGQAHDVTEYEVRKATPVGTTRTLEVVPPIAGQD